ncbi:MAG: iron-containing alcohol dehydrogenase [Nitriliruptoraceae bacterium]
MREFSIPTFSRVVHGSGCLTHLSTELKRIGVTRPMIVTSNTLATKTDVVAQAVLAAGGRVAGVAHSIAAHVPRDGVQLLVDQARDVGADGFVALGGGTAIDAAKAAAACLGAKVDIHLAVDTYRAHIVNGVRHIPELPGTPPPIIAIPTTLSGAEFTGVAGVTDPLRGVKDLLVSDGLTPVTIMLDPALTVHTPSVLWHASGIRGVDHVVEGVYSKTHHLVADSALLGALSIFATDLAHTSQDPQDLAARERCQLAAMMALMYLPNVAMGLSHGLGHQLGGRFGVIHGVTSCILLPHVMAYNRPVSAARQALLAPALGILPDRDATTTATAVADAVAKLISAVEVPTRLRDVGVTTDSFDAIAEEALGDVVIAGNPREPTHDDLVAILHAAY